MTTSRGAIINNIVSNLKEQNTERIYADILGFETPFAICYNDSRETYTPDVIAISNESVDLFSIEINVSTPVLAHDLQKWRIFQQYAKINNGNLYIAGDKRVLSPIKHTIDPVPSNLKFIYLI